MKYKFTIDSYSNAAKPTDFAFSQEEHGKLLEVVSLDYLRKTLPPAILGRVLGTLEDRFDPNNPDPYELDEWET